MPSVIDDKSEKTGGPTSKDKKRWSYGATVVAAQPR
jgi:hypothetical protein